MADQQRQDRPSRGGNQRGDGSQGRGRGRGGGGGGQRRGRGRGRRQEDDGPRLEEKLIQINRCATTVKGGRRMSFSAFVVVGDKKGKVGLGFGKAKEVPSAVEKAMKDARRKMVRVALVDGTVPHEIQGRFRSSRVTLLPASKGTGVLAGASARLVLECAGIENILTKQVGSRNALNVAKATLEGLTHLRTREMVEKLRGVKLA